MAKNYDDHAWKIGNSDVSLAILRLHGADLAKTGATDPLRDIGAEVAMARIIASEGSRRFVPSPGGRQD